MTPDEQRKRQEELMAWAAKSINEALGEEPEIQYPSLSPSLGDIITSILAAGSVAALIYIFS